MRSSSDQAMRCPIGSAGENGRRCSGFLARARPRAFSSGWWVRGGRSGELLNSPDRPPQGSPLFARFQAYGTKVIKVIGAWLLTLPRGALWVFGHGSHVAWSLTLALTGSPHASPCQEGDLKCASDGRAPLSPGACGQGIPSVVACFCRGGWGETKKGTSAIWRPVPFWYCLRSPCLGWTNAC